MSIFQAVNGFLGNAYNIISTSISNTITKAQNVVSNIFNTIDYSVKNTVVAPSKEIAVAKKLITLTPLPPINVSAQQLREAKIIAAASPQHTLNVVAVNTSDIGKTISSGVGQVLNIPSSVVGELTPPIVPKPGFEKPPSPPPTGNILDDIGSLLRGILEWPEKIVAVARNTLNSGVQKSLQQNLSESIIPEGYTGLISYDGQLNRTVFNWSRHGDYLLNQPFPTSSNVGTATDLYAGMGALVGGAFQLGSAWMTPLTSDILHRSWNNYPSNMPSASDLVRFELREVFRKDDRIEQVSPIIDDEVATTSQVFIDSMQRLGYNQYWADSYWAAHWELPSVGQGFEMFQRLRAGRVKPHLVFDAKELRTLLKKLDILPKYHQQLTEIAYVPFTRVDVRRMYKLEVLDFQGVVEAYQDIGYSLEKATQLAEFTRKDVDDDDIVSIRSRLITAYEDGIVKRDVLDKYVKPTFRDTTIYELLIEILDKKTAAEAAEKIKTPKTRDLSKAEIIRLVKNNNMKIDEASTLLRNMGYDDVEVRYLLIDYLQST